MDHHHYKQVIQYPRVVSYSTPDYDFSTNYTQARTDDGAIRLMTFVHLDVFYWSPSVYRDLMDVWLSVRQTLPELVFCHSANAARLLNGAIADDKFHKFVTRFGWVHLVDAVCSDGTIRPIYYHKKDT